MLASIDTLGKAASAKVGRCVSSEQPLDDQRTRSCRTYPTQSAQNFWGCLHATDTPSYPTKSTY